MEKKLANCLVESKKNFFSIILSRFLVVLDKNPSEDQILSWIEASLEKSFRLSFSLSTRPYCLTAFALKDKPILFLPLLKKIYLPSLHALKHQGLDRFSSLIWLLSSRSFHPVYLQKKPFFQEEYYYFFHVDRQKETIHFEDRRFLRAKPYNFLLLPYTVAVHSIHTKDSYLAEREKIFYRPNRNSPFYCKGDSTDRLHHIPFEKALLRRRTRIESPFSYGSFTRICKCVKRLISSFYFCLLRHLDGHPK